ncbi:hypothetical protein [Catenulispora subtropica]|uniref:Secreted protein n=1 Tax=Catenulispora subtropica TaxID=450798 RepID=A0ABN2SD08_9ACTN
MPTKPLIWKLAWGVYYLVAAVAVAWAQPWHNAKSAAEVRAEAGIPADAWFVAHVDGYSPGSYSHLATGVPFIAYNNAEFSLQRVTDDLILESWPVAEAGPCDEVPSGGLGGTVQCVANADGTWSAGDTYEDAFLITRRGSRFVMLGVSALSDDPIDPGRLPEIMASVHVADDHEVLASADGN